MMEVYHYTSKESLKNIQRYRYIKESQLSAADAFYGQGVYLTTMSPEEGRKRIADNNWGAQGPRMEESGRVECAIKLRIPPSNLKRAHSKDRDIWVHPGNVYLDEYHHSFIQLGGDDGAWWCAIL